MNPVEEYYEHLEEPDRSCLLALRRLILIQNEQISEKLSWKMPFFYYRNKMLCYLRQDKTTHRFYSSWSEGNQLHHPQLKQEGRKRFKVLYFNTNEDIDRETIIDLVQQSIESINLKMR